MISVGDPSLLGVLACANVQHKRKDKLLLLLHGVQNQNKKRFCYGKLVRKQNCKKLRFGFGAESQPLVFCSSDSQ